MISRELLSTVLGRPVQSGPGRILVCENNVALAFEDEDVWSDINIHELSHKCKEWGVAQQLKHNFHISIVTHKGSEYSATIVYWSDQLKNESFRASSEPEAVFKACEWILTQRGNNENHNNNETN